MRTLVLSTAILIGFAVHAKAGDQLAHSLGVTPGTYTDAQLAQLKAASEDDNGARFDRLMTQFGGAVVSTQSAGISSGHAQLAASTGVDPTEYSLTEITRLRAARSEDDATAERHLMSGGDDVVSSQSGGISQGHAMLAASLGVDPAEYTLSELVQLYAD